jgi:hypothetical protein
MRHIYESVFVITVAMAMPLRDFGRYGIFIIISVYCFRFPVIIDGQFTTKVIIILHNSVAHTAQNPVQKYTRSRNIGAVPSEPFRGPERPGHFHISRPLTIIIKINIRSKIRHQKVIGNLNFYLKILC